MTGGDPDVLAQMAVFRLDPWEQDVVNGSYPFDVSRALGMASSCPF